MNVNHYAIQARHKSSRTALFLAEGLTPGLTAPDEDERLEIMLVLFSELLRLINAGKIHDGKTLIAAMSYARLRAKSNRR